MSGGLAAGTVSCSFSNEGDSVLGVLGAGVADIGGVVAGVLTSCCSANISNDRKTGSPAVLASLKPNTVYI